MLSTLSRRLPRRRRSISGAGEAILRQVSVWSFGDNSQGALGLPFPPYEAFEPEKVEALPSDVVSVAAGHYHSLAVTASGDVWAWGRNDEGQLGRGVGSPRHHWSEPKKVEGLERVAVRAASASGVVSSVIGDDGSLWVWGKSKRGQLGLGKGLIQAFEPTRVEALAGEEIVKVSFGWGHAVARTRDGKLFGWGFSEEGRLGQMREESLQTPLSPPSNSIKITSSQSLNSVMEIIEEEVSAELKKEMDMPIIWDPCIFQELKSVEVSDVACGLDHSLVLCCDGTILSSGNNIYGQLGRTGDGLKLQPIDTTFQSLSVSAGLGHSLAICKIASHYSPEGVTGVATWGWNWGHQLGHKGPDDCPTIINGLRGETIVSASGGRAHSIALTAKGEVWTWGSGRNGRLGLGSSTDEIEPTMVECLNGVKVLQTVSGYDHSLLLVAD